MEIDSNIIIGGASLIVVVLSFLLIKTKTENSNLKKRFAPILSIDNEVKKIQSEKNDLEKSIEELRSSYKEKKAIFDNLVKEAAIYDEEIELAELGFYKPHFDFDTSEKYKEEIKSVRSEQKQMISDKTAIYCTKEWKVDGSKSKGQTMTNRAIRMTARAFNNECDAAISNVRWNNAERMEKRIDKAFEAINKLNTSNAIFISDEYLSLKHKELQLSYEYQEKKRQEKEEQAEIRRQMREEAKLQKEVEKTLKEEKKYEELLNKAKQEATQASDEKLKSLQEEIAKLTGELEEAHAASERALSMAQQTKSGHVYIISNMGSFGENVYKIGMTRRLDPIDRVKELGDASVPFAFDIHALIYSKDAPALENELHKAFYDRRLNLVNNRKEFFDVNLDEIKNVVNKHMPDAEFINIAEAREYKETNAIIEQNKILEEKAQSTQYPDEI